jgi:hypothetical protein
MWPLMVHSPWEASVTQILSRRGTFANIIMGWVQSTQDITQGFIFSSLLCFPCFARVSPNPNPMEKRVISKMTPRLSSCTQVWNLRGNQLSPEDEICIEGLLCLRRWGNTPTAQGGKLRHSLALDPAIGLGSQDHLLPEGGSLGSQPHL